MNIQQVELKKIQAVRVVKGSEYSWRYNGKNYRVVKSNNDANYKLYRDMEFIGLAGSIKSGKLQSLVDNDVF